MNNMELLTQTQRFNEINLPKESTYCIALMATAVQLNLISDANATKKMENITRYLEKLVEENAKNFAVSVSSKIILSNYFNILAVYLSKHTNMEAYELVCNNSAPELVAKAEKHYVNINKILMAKLAKIRVPEGMYGVIKAINNAYSHTMQKYLYRDLSEIHMKLFNAFFVDPTNENPIDYFWKSIEHFSVEVSIINKNFPDSIIKTIRKNLSEADNELKKEKIKKIDAEIEKVIKRRDERLASIDKRLKSYQEKEAELNAILDKMTDEEIECGKADEIMREYDFDMLKEEKKATMESKKVKENSQAKLQDLEEKKSRLTVKTVSLNNVHNMLKEILNEWLLYSYSISDSENSEQYANLTSLAKQNFVNNLDKKWIESKISELQLSERERKYLSKGLNLE